jgi:hypothetical protein
MALRGTIKERINPKKKLPSRAICRAEELFSVDHYKCLVKTPGGCQCAIFFGGAVFCQHPKREEIAAQTKKKLIKP